MFLFPFLMSQIETEHPSLFRKGNISIANIETKNVVSNFVVKPICHYFSIRLKANLETEITFLFHHYFCIGLETEIPFLFCTFRNGNRVFISLLCLETELFRHKN